MYFILAVLAARIQHVASFYRRGPFNGFLTVNETNNKSTNAPMVYRVLIPWLMKLTPFRGVVAYEFWRTFLLWLALVLVAGYWGHFAAVVWLVFVMSAQMYDTWCYTGETIGITLALTGNLPAAMLGAFVHGLSRETVLINGFVYWLATGDTPGAVILVLWSGCVFLYVRHKQGKKPLYCDRFMIARNWRILTRRETPKVEGADVPFFYGAWINIGIIILSLVGAYYSGRIGWTVPVIVLSTVTMGKINEYRLQIPVAVWAAWWLVSHA